MPKRITCLFYLRTPKKSTRELLNNTDKPNDVLLPGYFRITVDGQRTGLSTGETVNADMWNQARNRLKGNSKKVKTANASLDSFLNRAEKACQDLIDKNKTVSALTIKNQMQGIGQTFTVL